MSPLDQVGAFVLGGVLAVICLVVVIVVILRWAVRSGAVKGLVLGETPTTEQVAGSAAPSLTELIGQRGVALTTLRPAGAAMFADRRVDVVTEATFIPQGATVEVTAVEGKRVIVRQVSPESPESSTTG